jgi:hypothetical protein
VPLAMRTLEAIAVVLIYLLAPYLDTQGDRLEVGNSYEKEKKEGGAGEDTEEEKRERWSASRFRLPNRASA